MQEYHQHMFSWRNIIRQNRLPLFVKTILFSIYVISSRLLKSKSVQVTSKSGQLHTLSDKWWVQYVVQEIIKKNPCTSDSKMLWLSCEHSIYGKINLPWIYWDGPCPYLGDNCIQNFHLGRYIFRNLVLQRRASVGVKCDFRPYIRRCTSPNENFEYGYPHSNALLQFRLKLECCKPHKATSHPTNVT